MPEILQGKKFDGERSRTIKCAFCGGTGIQPRSLCSHCLACRGKGEVKFAGPVIECPTCQGSGRVSRSSRLSCLRCRGVGVVEKDAKAGEGAVDIMGERLGEITKRLRWTRKETERKTKEIEKKFEPIKPLAEEVKKEVKKEVLCLKELGNKVKKAWVSLWED